MHVWSLKVSDLLTPTSVVPSVNLFLFACKTNWTKVELLLIITDFSICGFRKTLSAQHAILYCDVVSTIQTNKDKRLLMFGVFIDLRKAFDTVDHKIL